MSTSTHDLRYLQTSDGTISQFCLNRAYGLHEQQRFSPQYRITCRPSTLHRVICFQFIPINRKFDSSASLFVRFKLLRSYKGSLSSQVLPLAKHKPYLVPQCIKSKHLSPSFKHTPTRNVTKLGDSFHGWEKQVLQCKYLQYGNDRFVFISVDSRLEQPGL